MQYYVLLQSDERSIQMFLKVCQLELFERI